MIFNGSIKYSLLSFDELVISLERLSRFKLPEETFPRVFYSIILKHLSNPVFSKKNIESIDAELISSFVSQIWNDSIREFCQNIPVHDFTYDMLIHIINNTFFNIDEKTNIFLNTKLIISPILNKIDYKNAPNNLKFLIKLYKSGKNTDLIAQRKQNSLCYPVSKVLIVEGITEEILLPVFADKLNKNLNKEGIYIISAGGKSKSPSLYMKLRNRLNIPIILLFDKDAEPICNLLTKIMRQQDKLILINKGEFEDLLPLTLIKRTLNSEYTLSIPLNLSELRISPKMCENIETFYRVRHLGEFKKAVFAKIISKNIKYNKDISEEIKNIIYMII